MSYYGMRALLVLYMTSHLFVSDGVAERVLGFGSIASLLADPSEAHFADHLASRVYGLYTGFVYFTPFFGACSPTDGSARGARCSSAGR